MTPELQMIETFVIGFVVLGIVALCAIRSQGRTIRNLVDALAASNRHLTAAAIAAHPVHRAQIAKMLLKPEQPQEQPEETPREPVKGLSFTEGGA